MSICSTLQSLCNTCTLSTSLVHVLSYNAGMAINTLEKGDVGTVVMRKNGVLQDTKTGRFVKGGKPTTAIASPSQGRELAQLRVDRKRLAVQQAANEAVESGDLRTRYGDMAFVAEITKTAMMKATTPDDPKAIDAARFILQEAGVSDKQASQEQASQTIGAVADLVQALASFAFDNSNYRKHDNDVIDADTAQATDEGGEDEADKGGGGG